MTQTQIIELIKESLAEYYQAQKEHNYDPAYNGPYIRGAIFALTCLLQDIVNHKPN